MHSLIASGISGGAAGYAGFYFEALKKRLQSDQRIPNKTSLTLNAWVKESFRGAGTYALCNIPATVVQQMVSNFLKKQYVADTAIKQAAMAIISGGLGGIPAAFLGNILLEQQLKSIGPAEALSNLSTQGISRLFRGVSLVMIREGMFGFCYLKGVSEVGNYASTHCGPMLVLPAQLAVGALGSLVSHPFDTVATIMQRYDYKNIKDAATYLWKENGVKAFYKGGAARIGLFTTTMITLNKVQQSVLDVLDGNAPVKFKPKI
ncbi:MAG: hypothetical protein KBD83_02490 [Gammaproteobacteria bacterium]|nr:hypothetical protein [Gammaproteobacteria bacterium]